MAKIIETENLSVASADLEKSWICAGFSFIPNLLWILPDCKPLFAVIAPIFPTSPGTSSRHLETDNALSASLMVSCVHSETIAPRLSTSPVKPLLDCPSSSTYSTFSFPKEDSSTSVVPGSRSLIRTFVDLERWTRLPQSHER